MLDKIFYPLYKKPNSVFSSSTIPAHKFAAVIGLETDHLFWGKGGIGWKRRVQKPGLRETANPGFFLPF